MRGGQKKSGVKPFVTVILAAGKGKRMENPDLPKVLFKVSGKPMIDYVVHLALNLESLKTIVVVGHHRDTLVRHLTSQFDRRVAFVEQRKQLGTGHAVLQSERALKNFSGDILVLSGDVPLLTEATVRSLLGKHQSSNAVATILTATTDDPTGYGRILRYRDGSVERIVEDRDASAGEKSVKEINSGIYVFKKVELFQALKNLRPTNVQKEYYLTGVFEKFWSAGRPVLALKANDFNEVHGINTAEELQEAEAIFQRRETDESEI